MKKKDEEKSSVLERPIARREFLKAGALAAAGMMLPAGCAKLVGSAAKPAKRPNVILFMVDQLPNDCMGYAGNGRAMTPNLDRMGREGIIFDAAYANSIPCIPSRASMMSGLNEGRFPYGPKMGFIEGLKPGSWTFAYALHEAGYSTALIGKMHFQPMRSRHGFDQSLFVEETGPGEVREAADKYNDWEKFMVARGHQDFIDERHLPFMKRKNKNFLPTDAWPLDPQLHPITWMRDRSIEYLESHKSTGKPFCLVVSNPYPHTPFEPNPEFLAMYDPAKIEVPTDNWDDMEGFPESLRAFKKKSFFPRNMKKEALQRLIAAYYAQTTQSDAAIGDIMKHVDLENTLVLFTSDHGDYVGRRGRILKNPLIPFEPIAHVPLLACGAGVPKGVRVEENVGLVDIAPTFLAAAGLPIPQDLDGTPLQNYFKNPNYQAERPICTHGPDELNIPGFDMVIVGKVKYFRNHSGKEEMLFDLTTDPGELKNLAADPKWQTKKEAMRREMDRVMGKPAQRLPEFAN